MDWRFVMKEAGGAKECGVEVKVEDVGMGELMWRGVVAGGCG